MRTLFESYLIENMEIDSPLQISVDKAMEIIRGGLRDETADDKHSALWDSYKILQGDPKPSREWN